jgi:hypothetical protein
MRRDEETRRYEEVRGGTRRYEEVQRGTREGQHTVKVTTSKIGGSLLMSLKGRRHLLNEHQKKGQQRLKKALVKNSNFRLFTLFEVNFS